MPRTLPRNYIDTGEQTGTQRGLCSRKRVVEAASRRFIASLGKG